MCGMKSQPPEHLPHNVRVLSISWYDCIGIGRNGTQKYACNMKSLHKKKIEGPCDEVGKRLQSQMGMVVVVGIHARCC